MTRILSLLVAVTLVVNASSLLAQEKKLAPYPTGVFSKVYSVDGRESLTISCGPKDPVVALRDPTSVDEIDCKFVHVRINPPDKRPLSSETPPTSLEDFEKKIPGFAEELKKNPKAKDEFLNMLAQQKQDFCSPKGRRAFEVRMGGPQAGPKRREFIARVFAACADKDPFSVFKQLADFDKRTCGLWVDRFELEFKKIGTKQWLFRQETPGSLSQVLKIYELRGEGELPVWTLTETRVGTGTSAEQTTRTVWSLKNYNEYELPSCDFLSHDEVQVP